MKKANCKNNSLSEIEDQLRNFIDLFKYVDDKDLFQRFYSKKLANRLIHNTSVSIELEEVAISGLKVGYYELKRIDLARGLTLTSSMSLPF